MRLILPILVLIVALAVSVAWDPPRERAEFVAGYTSIETLDAQVARASDDIRIAYALFEGLCTFDPEDFTIRPGVAASWDVSDDGLTYTFHLRPDARWSDGSPVTAHDFRFAWERGLMPDTQPPYIEFMFFIRGSREYFNWCQRELTDIRALAAEIGSLRPNVGRPPPPDPLPPPEPDVEVEPEPEEDEVWPRLRRKLPEQWVRDIEAIRAADPRDGAEVRRAAERLDRLEAGLADQQMRMARRRVDRVGAKFDELVGVSVPDDHTLIVELEQPVPYFLEIAATWPLFPLHRQTIERHTRLDPHTFQLLRDPQWTKPATIVGNGPYRLQAWEFKRRIRLEANRYYWNAGEVRSGSVELINFQDMNTMFIAYEAGDLDVLFGAGPLDFAADLLAQQEAGHRDDVHAFDGYGTYYFVFNCRETLPNGSPNPFADPRVRRAFAMATNKRPIVEQVTRLRQTLTSTFVPPGSVEGYEAPTGLPYDPDRARAEIAAAGFPGGEGFPPIRVFYNTGQGHDDTAQALARMWARELNVPVGLSAQEWKVFLRTRNEGNFYVARSGWFGDYSDPTTFLDLFLTDNGNNDAGFSDAAYDAMLERAAAELDPAERMAMLRRAEDYVINEAAPILPLYTYKLIHLYDPRRVRGVSRHPRNLQMFHHVEVLD